MNCVRCGCPICYLHVEKSYEKRKVCVRCYEAVVAPPTDYGKKPLAVRLRKREANRAWVQRNKEAIRAKRQAAKEADPEKYRAKKREYKRRYEDRIKANLPPIREQEGKQET